MSDSPNGVDRADSIRSQESNPKNPEKKKNRRPANTAFRQQRLKAWQPILTPKSVLPLFFAIGIIFAPIGGALLYASAKVQEIRIDYTDCVTAPKYNNGVGFGDMPPKSIHKAFKNSSEPIQAQWAWQEGVKANVTTGVKQATTIEVDTNICYIQFNLPETLKGPVLFYYYLENFYQNHRRYVESFDADQLDGKARTYSQIHGSKCTPLYGDKRDGKDKPYYPCGLIANSFFNDTFDSPTMINPPNGNGNETRVYQMENNTNIAWGSDKSLYKSTKYKPSEVIPPPNWALRYPNATYTDEHPPPDIENWEAFQVWMRTAGLPTFSKLYQRNDNEAMERGRYQIVIHYRFPTREYKGKKSILITTRTVMGGRSNFLGIAYLVVGGLCIVLGAVFTATHLIKPRKLGDHTYLSWNKVPSGKTANAGGGGTAVASGIDARPGEA